VSILVLVRGGNSRHENHNGSARLFFTLADKVKNEQGALKQSVLLQLAVDKSGGLGLGKFLFEYANENLGMGRRFGRKDEAT
jgi:hypothetical protein